MRNKFDFYATPEWATDELLRRVPSIKGTVLEPCSGEGDIVRSLESHTLQVLTNDLNPTVEAFHHLNAASPHSWRDFAPCDWVVTNPPYSYAHSILPLAYRHAREGVAMLLRLSYLEPAENRASWLEAHPPTELIVIPRISFTGDGKTDTMVCAWFVWSKRYAHSSITVVTKPKPVSLTTSLFGEAALLSSAG